MNAANASNKEVTEVFTRLIDAANDGDINRLLACTHEDVDWVVDPLWPEGGPKHGHEELRAFLMSFYDAWDQYSFDLGPIDFVGAVAMAPTVWNLRGTSSGVEQRVSVLAVAQVEDGRLGAIHFFFDRNEGVRFAHQLSDS